MTRVACIDIGTVTARLAVADVEGGRVTRMLKQSTICNLGEGLTQTGAISRAAADRVTECVDSYLAAAREAGAPTVCCTLTSAARDASNSDQLLNRLGRRGLHAQVIPGTVEGSLTFLGVAQDFAGHRILVADNGGGSTELAVGRMDAAGSGDAAAAGDATSGAAPAPKLALDCVRSVDVGCRRMTERFLSAHDVPTDQEVMAARAWARQLFDDAVREEKILTLAPERLVTTGGTVTTLVAIKLGLVPYDPRRVHLAELSLGDVEGLLARLAALPVEERAKLPGIQAKRAPVILGGAIAVAELMRAVNFDRLTVSESDLLFGLSICAAATAEGTANPLGWEPELTPLR
ncbi:MAG: phosphatase [Parafannyhessea sp.]|uniref:Ppx/GppA phosphatase family protein n=1 Tax=Parafannyhessea sp. TaxID=2847324 RepID=UPI003F1288FB